MPNRRRRRLSTAMSAVAALAVASPAAVVAVSDLSESTEPPTQHRQFVQAAMVTDLPNELMSALSQGLSQFGINLPPMPTSLLTGSGASTPATLTSPGLTTPGLTAPSLTTPGLTTPGLTTPGSDHTRPDHTRSHHAGPDHAGRQPAAASLPSATATGPSLTDPALTEPGADEPGADQPDRPGPWPRPRRRRAPTRRSRRRSPTLRACPLPERCRSRRRSDWIPPRAPTRSSVIRRWRRAPATGGSGGLLGDLSSAANQLGAGQAIDLLKGVVMPAIMSAVKPAGAPAAARRRRPGSGRGPAARSRLQSPAPVCAIPGL